MPKLDLPHHLGLTRCSRQVTETGKESQPTSSHTLAKVTEDGILTSILSLLEMRDAVRTSILSRRWRNLWTFIPNLKFDVTMLVKKDRYVASADYDLFTSLSPTEQTAILSNRTDQFIRSVDEFLHRHRGHGVNLFEVLFCLTKEHADHLDRWVDFAIRSGAKELTLVLYELILPRPRSVDLYYFPFHLFDNGKGSSIESISVSDCYLFPHATFTGFSSLKSLSLSYLYLTDAQIRILLSCCFVIERLSIEECNGFVNLDIYQQSGRLNSLIIFNCPELLKIELDSVVLKFLEYKGDWPVLYTKNRARVVNATIDLGVFNYITDSSFPRLASEIPQLEGLSVRYGVPHDVADITSNSYKLAHLKKLYLDTKRSKHFDAFRLALILNAAPLLEEFHVNIYGWRLLIEVPPNLQNEPRAKKMRLFGCDESLSKLCGPDMTHMKLRQFKLGGFDGWIDEVDLVSYVMRNAVALELVSVGCASYRYSFISGWKKAQHFSHYNSADARLDGFRQLSQIPRPSGAKLLLRQQ